MGTGLTQIGEFSFILVQVAHASGLIGDEFYYAMLAASLMSILHECHAGARGAEVARADASTLTDKVLPGL